MQLVGVARSRGGRSAWRCGRDRPWPRTERTRAIALLKLADIADDPDLRDEFADEVEVEPDAARGWIAGRQRALRTSDHCNGIAIVETFLVGLGRSQTAISCRRAFKGSNATWLKRVTWQPRRTARPSRFTKVAPSATESTGADQGGRSGQDLGALNLMIAFADKTDSERLARVAAT